MVNISDQLRKKSFKCFVMKDNKYNLTKAYLTSEEKRFLIDKILVR